jgi:hypothetical protein
MGIRGEPTAPENPARGLVWTAIMAQTDQPGSASDFVSVADAPRVSLARHPWSIGGGGASELREAIESGRPRLVSASTELGITSVSGEDDAFVFDNRRAAERLGVSHLQPLVVGDEVRDYRVNAPLWAVWPHGPDFEVLPLAAIHDVAKYMWKNRAAISRRKRFGTPMLERGLTWYEFQEIYPTKLRTPLTITFAFVATHNHFVLDRGGKVFNRSAPVIKLPAGVSEDDHLGLLGLLNTSTACFWLKQVSHNKGGQGINEGAKAELWERFIEVTATRLESFPLANAPPIDIARSLDATAQCLSAHLPSAVTARAPPSRAILDAARAGAELARCLMIAKQEELDWRSYHLYGLLDDAPEHPDPPPLRLGERAFEIAMARSMALGDLETTWFERHRSTPIKEIPAHWPPDYRAVVERRLALIGSDPNIRAIERPEYDEDRFGILRISA